MHSNTPTTLTKMHSAQEHDLEQKKVMDKMWTDYGLPSDPKKREELINLDMQEHAKNADKKKKKKKKKMRTKANKRKGGGK